MSRLIDADALLERLQFSNAVSDILLTEVFDLITNAPTVQREGWVSVPIEPTEEMIDAAFVFLKDGGVENIDGDDIRGAIRHANYSAPKE
jgi:hypothetical protein